MIELRTLGAVDLRGADGRELRSILASPKRFALLACLALQSPSGFQRRDTLRGLFWPEPDQDHARNSLRNALSILRRGLGNGVLVSRGDEVGLEETRLWCDVVALEGLLDAGELEPGLALYRGDLLEGFFITGAPDFERWLEARRTGLRERAARAAWELAERQEAEGNSVSAAHWARRAAALAPYDEEGLRRLVELLERLRDRSGAIAAYDAFAQRLASDLQLEPTAETRALIEAVRAGGARTAATSGGRTHDHANLPRPHSAVTVGRQPAVEATPSDSREAPTAEPPPATEPAASPALPVPVEAPSPAFLMPAEARAPRAIRGRRRPALLGAVALSLVLGLAGLHFVLSQRGDRRPGQVEAAAASAEPSIAILPFEVRGSGLEVWREGMVDVLSTNLDGVGGVRAVSRRTVLARWREGAREGTPPDLEMSLDVARRAGARYALVGDALSAGPRMRLAASLYDVASGRSLGAEQVEGSPDSVFSLVDRLSLQLLRTIPNVDESELGRANLARATTASIPALKAYLEGERLFRHSDFEGAVAAYRRAVEADSTFALPLWKLGSWLSFAQDLEAASLDRLESLAERLPAREALLVRADVAIRRGETHEGLSLLRKAAHDYPDDPDIWYQLGEMYFHRWDTLLVDREEAGRAFAKVIELDPSFAPAYIHLVNTVMLVYADSARAARLIEAHGRLAPADQGVQHDRIAFGLAFGDSAL